MSMKQRRCDRRCERGASIEVLSSRKSKKGLPREGAPQLFFSDLLSNRSDGDTRTDKNRYVWKFSESKGRHTIEIYVVKSFPFLFRVFMETQVEINHLNVILLV